MVRLLFVGLLFVTADGHHWAARSPALLLIEMMLVRLHVFKLLLVRLLVRLLARFSSSGFSLLDC